MVGAMAMICIDRQFEALGFLSIFSIFKAVVTFFLQGEQGVKAFKDNETASILTSRKGQISKESKVKFLLMILQFISVSLVRPLRFTDV